MKPLVIFDRDGTLNYLIDRPHAITAPWEPKEFILVPGAIEAVKKVQKAGFDTCIITNQPGILDGDMTEESLSKINRYIQHVLGIEEIYSCINRNNDRYKPNNGMFERVLKDRNRSECWVIGDRWKDIVPGHKSGINTMYVGKEAYSCPFEHTSIQPNYTFSNVLDACNKIVELSNVRRRERNL
jgi:D-glycero-D-manno-heptose 1,7-bisphosphate phosphatase